MVSICHLHGYQYNPQLRWVAGGLHRDVPEVHPYLPLSRYHTLSIPLRHRIRLWKRHLPHHRPGSNTIPQHHLPNISPLLAAG